MSRALRWSDVHLELQGMFASHTTLLGKAANCARVSDHHIVQRDEMSCALYNGGWTARDSMCYLEHAPIMERVMNLNTPGSCL